MIEDPAIQTDFQVITQFRLSIAVVAADVGSVVAIVAVVAVAAIGAVAVAAAIAVASAEVTSFGCTHVVGAPKSAVVAAVGMK